MPTQRTYGILLLVMACLCSCQKEEIIFDTAPGRDFQLPLLLKLDGRDCFLDSETRTMRYSIATDSILHFCPVVEFQEYAEVILGNTRLINQNANDLGDVFINTPYALVIKAGGVEESFQLVFTSLPVVRIVTMNSIYDEPKSLARIFIDNPKAGSPTFSSFIGIEYRGGMTQRNNKKSYGFNLLYSMDLDHSVPGSLMEMKQNTSWILDGMSNDPARLRNKYSFDVWNSFPDPALHPGIHAEHVELFINHEHQGLYCLSERINPLLLELSDPEGVLYKSYDWAGGATNFEYVSEEVSHTPFWDGWEQIYPLPDERINWDPLAELRNLVVHAADDEFVAEIGTLINIPNFLDYYLFINLAFAMDNTGKNTYLFRRDQYSSFIIFPWDMDGTWGRLWNGTAIGHDYYLTNRLYERLLETDTYHFRENIRQRWAELRRSNLSQERLTDMMMTDFNAIKKTGIYEIENMKWNTSVDYEAEAFFMTSWVEKRLMFLDEYFGGL